MKRLSVMKDTERWGERVTVGKERATKSATHSCGKDLFIYLCQQIPVSTDRISPGGRGANTHARTHYKRERAGTLKDSDQADDSRKCTQPLRRCRHDGVSRGERMGRSLQTSEPPSPRSYLCQWHQKRVRCQCVLEDGETLTNRYHSDLVCAWF